MIKSISIGTRIATYMYSAAFFPTCSCYYANTSEIMANFKMGFPQTDIERKKSNGGDAARSTTTATTTTTTSTITTTAAAAVGQVAINDNR